MVKRYGMILIVMMALFCTGCHGAGMNFPTAADGADAVSTPSDRFIVGDQVKVTVLGEADMSGIYVIESDGGITLPLIGRITATGRDTSSLAVEIANTLKSRGYLVAPDVRIDGVQMRKIAVMGEVLQAGDYPWTPQMTVLDAVARAGGFSYRANQTAFDIIRKNKDGKQIVVASDLSTRIYGGDVLRVRERFF